MTDTQQSIDDIFRVHVLGVGNYDSELHSTVSFLVQAGERLILLEAPAELRKKLKEYREILKMQHGPEEMSGIDSLVIENIKDIIVTHVHGDHADGLQNIAWYKMYKQQNPIFDFGKLESIPSRRPKLYGTEGVLYDIDWGLQASLSTSGLGPDEFFDMVPAEFGKVLRIGEVELELLQNHHGLNGFATIMRYRGRSFSYSGDTKFDNNLANSLASADVMVHECDGSNIVHTTPDELATWAKRSKYNGQLYVCHMDDSCHPEDHGLRPLQENDFIDINKSA